MIASYRLCATAAAALALAWSAAPLAQARAGSSAVAACAALQSLAIPDATVLSAEPVAAGRFAPPAATPVGTDLARRAAAMPAFCRVRVLSTPVPGSRIGSEIWLPLRGWNGRFLGAGNLGAAGSITYATGMIEGLERGFAVANTDMGAAPEIGATMNNPESWTDYGHRSTHEMTRVAKLVVRAFFRVATFRSYFAGCSTGGQQALVSAQRYPEDYDGILAGDPGSNRTHSVSYFLWNYRALNETAGSRLSPAQWAMITQAVLATCAGKDGGAPGDAFLTDPRLCAFDPASLPSCAPSAASDQCLTPPQLAAVRRLYGGPVNPRTGERIYPGLTVGSEDLPLGPAQQGDPGMVARLYVLHWALGEPVSPATFNFDRDLDRVDARLASALNANDSDLGDFARRGGKLILYTGLADPGVPFADVVQYYERVLAAAGETRGRAFARLFLVPGMGHCLGGPGVTDIGQPMSSAVPPDRRGDALMALVAWRERGTPPSELIARKPGPPGALGQERPVCAYPALPEYRGGDPRARSSFACAAHARGAGALEAARYLN